MNMKTKILTLVLTLIILTLTVASCVQVPIDDNGSDKTSSADVSEKAESSAAPAESSSAEAESSAQPIEESSQMPAESSAVSESASSAEESSAPAESSSAPVESSQTNPPEESSKPSVSEPVSEEPSEPVSNIDPSLPYPDVTAYKYPAMIKPNDYDSYFNDAMFLGNSIMYGFKGYTGSLRTMKSDFLGDAFVLGASAWSPYHDEQGDEYLLTYNGNKMHCAQVVAATGAKTLYIQMMALNELGLHNKATCVQDTFDETVRLIERIRAASPGITIVILSNTYMHRTMNFSRYNLNNANISALNNLALAYCNQNGIDFVDVSTPLMQGNALSDKYCSDPIEWDSNGNKLNTANGCHLMTEGYTVWTAILRNYVWQKRAGTWQNPASMPTYTTN